MTAAWRRALLAAAGGVTVAASAGAHPMGDTSINHYAGIEISRDGIRVKYLLDFAELPAQRELARVDPDGDDRVTPEERAAYLVTRTSEILPALRLEVNVTPRALHAEWSGVTFPPGQGGLSTVRIAWELRADGPDSLLARNFLLWSDSNGPGAPGWKEIRISALDDLGIARTSLGWNPTSGELSEYPEAYLWNPPTDTKAWCHFGPGLSPEALPAAPGEADGGPEEPRSRRAGLLLGLGLLAVTAAGAVVLARRRR